MGTASEAQHIAGTMGLWLALAATGLREQLVYGGIGRRDRDLRRVAAPQLVVRVRRDAGVDAVQEVAAGEDLGADIDMLGREDYRKGSIQVPPAHVEYRVACRDCHRRRVGVALDLLCLRPGQGRVWVRRALEVAVCPLIRQAGMAL